MLCNRIYKYGHKKGKICGKSNCLLHDDYNGNLAIYLGLPDMFVKIAEKYKNTIDYIFLVIEFECSLNNHDTYNQLNFLKKMFDLINISCYELKKLYIIYVFLYMDTDFFNNNLLDIDLKKVLDQRLLYHMNLQTENSIEFSDYIKTNFVTGKKFINKYKNF